MEFPPHFIFPPKLTPTWQGVKLVLDCTRFKNFDALQVEVDEPQVILQIHLLNPLVDSFKVLVPVDEPIARYPLSQVGGIIRDVEGAELRWKEKCAECYIAGWAVLVFVAMLPRVGPIVT